MSAQAIKLIQHCLDTKDPFLDIGNCRLTDKSVAEGSAVDKLLRQCIHLETLILSDHWYEYEADGSLRSGYSRNNGNKNRFCQAPPALEKLVQLVTLVCNGDVTGQDSNKWEINSTLFLAPLINLQRLHINDNKITEIRGLDRLVALRYLNLSFNEIQEINGLDNLPSLQILHLGGNQIREIKGLDNLTALKYLNLTANSFTEIKGLDNLPSLQHLNLNYNHIQQINGLDNLTALQSLYLIDNYIQDLKPLLPFFKKKENPLQIVTKDGWQIGTNEIYVKGNPLISPPIEIVEQGNEAVLRYFSEELEVKFEAKILIVGEPQAGKTSLMKKLVDPHYIIPNNEDSTVGIQVIKWSCDHDKIPESIQLNIWDFGGQEMQYLTHQFFLSSDALYILLTSARKDFDNLDYWFNIISLLGKNESNENSELVVVANEINMQEGQVSKSFDAKKYQDLYPHLPFTFQPVNLATAFDNDGRFATLQHLIKERLIHLRILGKELPTKWGVARRILAALNVNYLPIQEYLSVCKGTGIGEMLALDLSSYLHKIGEAVHFQTEDYVILNPKWALDGVYSILKRKEIEESDGHFTQQQIYSIWEKDGYTYPERNLLLSLMAKDSFEVTYKIQGKKDEYIAPQLLAVQQPDFHWDKKGALHFRYFYPFIPKGIITRLIVRLHEVIKYVNGKGLVWRTGVFFEKNGCIAKVEETKIPTTGQQVIAIEILGNTSNRKLLLYDICSTIEGIHKNSFSKIVFDRQIPCNCEHCTDLEQPGFFDYSELIEYYNNGIESIRCKIKVRNEQKVKSLLEDFFDIDLSKIYQGASADLRTGHFSEALALDPFRFNKNENKKKKVFISYSHDDIEYRQEMQKFLVNIERDGLIEIWQDGLIMAGEDWDEKIKQSLKTADICILLVSQQLISSNYSHEVEFKTIMEKRKNETCCIIPVLVEECDWKNWKVYPVDVLEALGKKAADYKIKTFQFLPIDRNKRIKVINKWKHPEEAWLQVAETIREFCKK